MSFPAQLGALLGRYVNEPGLDGITARYMDRCLRASQHLLRDAQAYGLNGGPIPTPEPRGYDR